MDDSFEKILEILGELKEFASELGTFLVKTLHLSFLHFEEKKGIFVSALYRQRGKYGRRIIHYGMGALAAFGVAIAPIVAQEFPGRSVNPWTITSAPSVLSYSTQGGQTDTRFTNARDAITEYSVQAGDTVGSIAQKFGVSENTVRWQNNLSGTDNISVGQKLEILSVTGIAHKVEKGDTVYSIAKEHDVDPQVIVNYPFNTFANDETFELAIGQVIIVPEGVKTKDKSFAPRIRQITPDAGTVVAQGNFVWPTSGVITQYFVWYHPAIDIANAAAPAVLAVDSGRVIESGWSNAGYGNHVVIDHGNGFKTLYGHLSRIYVVEGQTVARGNQLGQMGSTGRSTGTHLHFEVIQNGTHINPLSVLR